MTDPVRDVRMFESDFFEFFSKTAWWAVPIVHCPIMYVLSTYCEGSLIENMCWVVFGVLFWTFSEYVLHRFVFHGETTWMA